MGTGIWESPPYPSSGGNCHGGGREPVERWLSERSFVRPPSFDWRRLPSHRIVIGIPELGSISVSVEKRGSNLQQSSVWRCGSLSPTLPRAGHAIAAVGGAFRDQYLHC